ncbi:hypothetical protein DSM3645_02688 [Blastopirellula marina DSM 3645]|uniref:Uncharacterized protein n=1 Tax=Blastopirellula marina DSM 3645 TaxID=314230 RepID=A3ZVK1_9BACT|nr:hypothetical protein DSM3645_02688 [Blastopirellula marina DSM 3645]
MDTEREVRAAFQDVLQMFNQVHPGHTPALTKN